MPQGTYKHTVDDLMERTGLPRHFINRCSSKLSDILDPYRQHGDNNQLFYDDSGLTIFDQIGQLKRDGKTIPEIKSTLESHLQNQQDHSQSDRKSLQYESQNPQNQTVDPTVQTTNSEVLVSALQEAYQEVATTKDQVIQSKAETINSLQQNLQLLTDGRDPETVKKEQEAKIKEAADKDQKLEQLRQERKRQEKKRHARQRERDKLLAELKSLEGKWFSSDRRQEIITELKRLDREEENSPDDE